MNILLILILLFGLFQANQTQPSITVTLRDINDAGIPNAIIIIRDAQGQHEQARGQTDAQGNVSFSEPLATPLRIAVEGRLPHRIRLYQDGFDASGVLIHELPVTLDLRVEPDGKVIPDPVTMLSQDTSTADEPVAALPTAPIAPRLTAQVRMPTPQVAQPPQSPAPGGIAEPPSPWNGAFLLTLLLGACVGVLILQSRWRAGL